MSFFSSIGNAVSGVVNKGLSILGGQQTRDDTRGLVNQGISAGDPFNEGARQPFIQGLTSLLGPDQTAPGSASNFLTHDPIVQAQKGMIGDWMQANFAKSGNLPMTSILGSNQLANVFGNELNQRIGQLMTAGGFPLQNAAVGQVVGNAMNPMATSNMQTQNFLGGILGMGAGMLSGGGGAGGGAASGGLGSLVGMGVG